MKIEYKELKNKNISVYKNGKIIGRIKTTKNNIGQIQYQYFTKNGMPIGNKTYILKWCKASIFGEQIHIKKINIGNIKESMENAHASVLIQIFHRRRLDLITFNSPNNYKIVYKLNKQNKKTDILHLIRIDGCYYEKSKKFKTIDLLIDYLQSLDNKVIAYEYINNDDMFAFLSGGYLFANSFLKFLDDESIEKLYHVLKQNIK